MAIVTGDYVSTLTGGFWKESSVAAVPPPRPEISVVDNGDGTGSRYTDISYTDTNKDGALGSKTGL